MASCTSCGATLTEETRFCDMCGLEVAPRAIAGSAKVKTIEVIAPPAATWYVTLATGQAGGPFNEDVIRGMIARQQIKITDSVLGTGGSTWVPITQSSFAQFFVAQASINRLAASTCPRCGAEMTVVTKNSVLATFLIIGVCFAPFIIGIPLIIVGLVMRRRPTVNYRRPRCNHRPR